MGKQKINLDNVTLVCIDGRDYNKERTLLYRSIFAHIFNRFNFKKSLFFSHIDYDFAGVEIVKIEKLHSISEYSNFCMRRLNPYISTDFCMIIQDDGFILNHNLWDSSFLDYDYIGAPWPIGLGNTTEETQVGNGGFCIRSKRFLEFSSKLFPTMQNEDKYILETNRKSVNVANLKIAPVELAKKFSVEISIDSDHTINNSFGFHAKHLLPDAIKYIEKNKTKMSEQIRAFNTDAKLAKRFLDFKKKYKIKSAIETGTYHGDTTKWLAENFENVYTVEYDQRYLDVAKQQISDYPNIHSYLGSSTDYLGKFLDETKDCNSIIFLDAHWYANPVLQELDRIKESGLKPVLAIHDFKVPERPDLGYDEYPNQGIVYEWEWIKEKIEGIYGSDGYEIEYNTYSEQNMRGCIFILPKK